MRRFYFPALIVLLLCSVCVYAKKTTALVVNLGNDTTICDGTSLLLNAGNAGASYVWNTGAYSQTITVSTPGKYYVTVTNGVQTVSDTILVNVNPTLFTDFSFFTLGTCAPVMAQFSDLTQTCGTSIASWKWSFGDGNTSISQEPVHYYNATGTYTVKLTATTTDGETMTRSKLVTITATHPTVNLGNDTSICEDEFLTLDAGNAGASYYWSTGATTQTITVGTSGNYWVQVTDAGCSANDTVKLTVKPALFANFGYKLISNCLPVPVSFTDSSSACNATIQQWKWEFGDGTTSALQNPSHSYTVSGTYIVKLTVRNNFGYQITRSKPLLVTGINTNVHLGNDTTFCFGSSLMLDAGNTRATYLWSTGENTQRINVSEDGEYSVQVFTAGCVGYDTIKVSSILPAKANFNFNALSKCLPVQVNFADSSTSYCGSNISSWKWEFNDGTSSTLQHPSHIYNAKGTYEVKLTITTNTGVSIARTKNILIETTAPYVNLGNDTSVCKGGSVMLYANNPGAVFNWSPSPDISDATIANPVVTPKSSVMYTVAVTACGSTTLDSIVVYVDSVAKPAITVQDALLTSSPSLAYQWYKDGKIINNAVSRTYRITANGNYQVEVTNAKGCKNISAAYFYMPGGGHQLDKNFRIKLSPNPTKGTAYLLMSKLPEKPVAVKLYSQTGVKIVTLIANAYSTPINIANKPNGIYFIEIIVNDKRLILPLIKY
jgi:PKD repeat protein